MRTIRLKFAALSLAAIAAASATPVTAAGEYGLRDAGTRLASPPIAESEADINAENAEFYVERLEATESIKKLISAFALFRSANLVPETVDLFDQAAIFDHDGGQWVGKESIARLLNGRFNQPALAGTVGPRPNVLNERYVTQYVIDISRDNMTASARFREVSFVGVANESHRYIASLYEAQFLKTDGVWRIAAINHCEAWSTNYDEDLAQQELPVYPKPAPALFPKEADAPDRLSTKACKPWPYGGITPTMHYPHPVTGEPVSKP
jgi:hypothetical protein